MKVTLRKMMFLVLVFYLPALVSARIGHSKKSLCLDEIKSGTLALGCPNNQLIKLGRVIYGYSWSNDCSYIDKDCTMDVPRDDIICLTTANCTIRVVEHPLILQDCWNLAATYVQAEYECIAEYSLQNVCQPQDTTLSYGFLSTPNYPHGFTPNLNCPCALFASPGYAIVLEVIDFRLPACSEAGLILWLGQDFQTKCLTQDPLTVVSNVQQNVTLRFYTLSHVKHGGFLIKYSVLPISNNATVRLQCYVAPAVSRPSSVTDDPSFILPPPQQQHPSLRGHEINHDGSGTREHAEPIPVEIPSQIYDVTHPNELTRRIPTEHEVIPPILGTVYDNKDYMPIDTGNKQQPVLNLNQSTYKRYLLPNSTPFRRSNMTLVVVCVVAGVIFLLIMINALIWFIFSLRPSRSKSRASFQNLYRPPLPPATISTETKTISSYPTPIQPRRHSSQSSIRMDNTSILSGPFMYRNQILPQAAPSNRLKTLRSLLFRGHKTLGIDPIEIHRQPTHNFDSTPSEYHARSVSQTINASKLPKSRYEEQEDCVDLKSEGSIVTNPNHGLLNRTKSNHEPRQINSWDDI